MKRTAGWIITALMVVIIAVTIQAQGSADPYADVAKSRMADGGYVLGNPDAGIKLIEFSDFLCTSCQNYEPIIAAFIEDYVRTGQAQFEYRIFPVVDPQLSILSAGLVECADIQQPGLFWHAHDVMFEQVSVHGFTDESATVFAETLGLDAAALSDCAISAGQTAVDLLYGLDLGVKGTPSLFVQYGESDPVQIALALSEHYSSIANAIRPESSEPVTIELGKYAGLTTYRRNDGAFVIGEPDASLTIVAFEDFLCPYCQGYLATVQEFIGVNVRSGQASFEYRLYPLINPQYSTRTAQIAECVANQDLRLFWDAHDLLFEFASTGNLGEIEANISNLLDLDQDALLACLGRSMQFLVDTRVGQSAGVSGTPAVRARVANGEMQLIYSGTQPIDRGGAPLEVLSALAEGADNVSIGEPEVSLLNDSFLADNSIVTREPCGPPCWQDIVPGVTTFSDALAILEASEYLRLVDAASNPVVFAFNDGPPCCQIFSQDGETVTSMLLQLAPRISISEVIAVLGEPPFVVGQPFTESEAMMTFYYPEHNMLLYVVVPGLDGQLEETSPVVSVIYASDTLFESAFATASFDFWKGYLKYSDYMDGEFDYSP